MRKINLNVKKPLLTHLCFLFLISLFAPSCMLHATIDRPRQLFVSSVQLSLSLLYLKNYFCSSSQTCSHYNLPGNNVTMIFISVSSCMKLSENSRNLRKCTKDRSTRKVEHHQQRRTRMFTSNTRRLNTILG